MIKESPRGQTLQALSAGAVFVGALQRLPVEGFCGVGEAAPLDFRVGEAAAPWFFRVGKSAVPWFSVSEIQRLP